MSHLRVLAVHWGEGSLFKRFKREEPPWTFDNKLWVAFVHAIAPEVEFLEGGGYQSLLPKGVRPPTAELTI